MPSPSHLRRKILIKAKRLPEDQGAAEEEDDNEEDDERDESQKKAKKQVRVL